jgi:hypothetical protein
MPPVKDTFKNLTEIFYFLQYQQSRWFSWRQNVNAFIYVFFESICEDLWLLKEDW